MNFFKNSPMLFATVMVAASVLALMTSVTTNAHAVPYGSDFNDQYSYGYGDKSRYNDDKYSYDDPRDKSVSVQEIKCQNKNVNVNGIDITEIPHDTTTTDELQANEQGPNGGQNGNGFDKINFDRNLVNICLNVNVNNQEEGPPPT
jgi:hypothetical protein